MKVSLTKSAAFAGALALAAASLTPAVHADGMPRGGAARAAPVVQSSAFSWTGFYVGANAGYAWGNADPRTAITTCAAGCVFNNGFAVQDFANINSGGSRSLSPDGFAGGVHAGYNWQSGSAVLGVEVDFGAFNVNASRSSRAPFVALVPTSFHTVGTSVDTDWLFTARGRLGWAVAPQVLLFATGGLAVTDIRVTNAYIDTLVPPGVGASSADKVRTGWTVGGGLEWAMSRNWTLRGEYLYVDFGKVSTIATITATGFTPNTMTTRADLDAHLARAGLSYRF